MLYNFRLEYVFAFFDHPFCPILKRFTTFLLCVVIEFDPRKYLIIQSLKKVFNIQIKRSNHRKKISSSMRKISHYNCEPYKRKYLVLFRMIFGLNFNPLEEFMILIAHKIKFLKLLNIVFSITQIVALVAECQSHIKTTNNRKSMFYYIPIN